MLRRLLMIAVLAIAGLVIYEDPGHWLGDTAQDSNPQTTEQTTAQADSQQAGSRHLEGQAQIDATMRLIDKGGPFPHSQDGTVFQNREGRLPEEPRGYYHEYTVETPGLDHRGARRIVTGGNPPEIFYYTADHYDSFIVLEKR